MFTAVAALSLACPASVQAVPTTYQYTGNNFTDVFGSLYATSDFVTAMVTLAGPLGANMPLTHVNPTAFTFSDGVQTITNLTPPPVTFFAVATGPAGQITDWHLIVGDGMFHGIVTVNRPALELVADEGFVAISSYGLNQRAAGTWTTVGAVADTGSTLSMMTLTLMALGLVARRFQRAAA